MSPGVEKTTQSGIDHIDQLISYRKWALDEDRTITWTITKEDAIFSDEPYGIKGELPYFKAITNPWTVANINKAMFAFSSVLDINLEYIDESPAEEATIRFNAYADPTRQYAGGVWGYGPYTHAWGGDVWTSWYAGIDVYTAMHEIGHVLGLDHPGHVTRVNIPGFTTIETVMSYNGTRKQVALDEAGNYVGAVASDALGIYDIAALQYLYGVNRSHNAGNTTYSYDPDVAFYTTIWDGGGEDTLDLSNYRHGSAISLSEGTYSSVNYFVPPEKIDKNTYLGESAIGIAYGVVIENAIGTQGDDVIQGNATDNRLVGGLGDDQLYGGAGDDRLEGGNGNDILDGGSGTDIMIGGAGDDSYHVDSASDVVTELLGGGIDTVHLSIDARSSKLYLNVENFIATEGGNAESISGNDLNNTVIGNSLDNLLFGCEGDDVLAGGKGNDNLTGGKGNDTFVFYRGDGNDLVLRGLTTPEDIDTLSFKDINSDQLWFSADAKRRHLVINVIGTNDSVTVSEYFAQRKNVLDVIEVADGKFLDTANIDKLIDAMAAFAPPALGQTNLPNSYQQALAPVLAAAWA